MFTLAHWHALAKLRQHTDLSLVVLETVTIQLGTLLRKFQADTCTAYDTRELKREMAARVRQAAAASKSTANQQTSDQASAVIGSENQNSSATSHSEEASNPTMSKPTKSVGRQRKALNLKTYKDHSLGDYVETIRQYGTVDSYSTESVRRFCFIRLKRHTSWGIYRWN